MRASITDLALIGPIACDLSEKYFDMNKKQCRDALDLYKKFLIRMDRVGEFLKVAEVSYTHSSHVKDGR